MKKNVWEKPLEKKGESAESGFRYTIDRFADLKVMRYRVPGWESLDLKKKILLYYLSEAADWGRDILFDQNFRYNLLLKRVLERIYACYPGERDCEDFSLFTVYLKRFWFSNGLHHHYGCDKFFPACSPAYLEHLMRESSLEALFAEFLSARERVLAEQDWEDSDMSDIGTFDSWIAFLLHIVYSPDFAPKRISLDSGKGLLENSSCHYYSGVGTSEAESFYREQKRQAETSDPDASVSPVSYGLNTRLVRKNGKVTERVCRKGGLYSEALCRICENLEKALPYAESEAQRRHLEKLLSYYADGDLKKWDAFNILWVEDADCFADYNNGFIETYGDPLGLKASWEAISDFRDMEATKRTETISAHAQWFEDHSPVDPRFRKEKVKGVSAKVITVVQLGGDCFPTPPIGINLPNADWIRHRYGSKSVTIENICDAYDQSAKEKGGMLEEFAYDEAEILRNRTFSTQGGNLHTDLHECLGHGSGRLLDGVASDALKNYASTLEEARADLFALYYLADPKMRELGLWEDEQVYMAEYDSYMRNGLMTQLVRVELGKDLEEAHMRNRSLVAHWVYRKAAPEGAVLMGKRAGKTFVHIADYGRLRILFGELLAEVQRIKSEGDFEAGKALVEDYGVRIDRALHEEILERYRALDSAPYGGFVNPKLEPVFDSDGRIFDVEISYPDDFAAQMMDYARRYSALPLLN